MSVVSSPESILRSPSVKGPVALMIPLALISHVSPVNVSFTLAPYNSSDPDLEELGRFKS